MVTCEGIFSHNETSLKDAACAHPSLTDSSRGAFGIFVIVDFASGKAEAIDVGSISADECQNHD